MGMQSFKRTPNVLKINEGAIFNTNVDAEHKTICDTQNSPNCKLLLCRVPFDGYCFVKNVSYLSSISPSVATFKARFL